MQPLAPIVEVACKARIGTRNAAKLSLAAFFRGFRGLVIEQPISLHYVKRLTVGRPVHPDRVGETPCVFLAGLHREERTIAERLMRQANGRLPWPWIDPNKALPWVEERIGLALAESQIAAIRLALMSKVLVMTGGPGVGKTN